MMKDIDPKLVGINYDVGHAHIEGGLGGWIASWRVSGAHVRGIALKDYVWNKDARGRWREQWCPIGAGMVHFPEFFGMVAASDFDGPVQVHYEYPLPEDRPGIYAAMKKDLTAIRGYMAKAGL
jgi:sugar phosphate isomerase/epimerase